MEEARVQRLAEPSGWGSGFSRDRDGSRESWSGAVSPRDGRSPRPQGRPPLRGSEPLDQRLERWVNRGRDLVDGVSGARPGGRPAGGRDRDTGVGGSGGGFNPARLGRWVEQRLDWLLDEDGEDDWREPWQEESARSAAAGPATARGSAPRAVAAADGPGGWLEPRSERLAAPAAPPAAGSPVGRRRGLEAISRRGSTGDSTGAAAPPFIAAAAGNAAAAGRVPAGSLAAAARPPVAAPRSPDGRRPSAMPVGPEDSPPDQDAWPDEACFSVPRWRRPPAERPTDPLARPAAPPAGAPEEGGGRPLPRSSRRR
jgi:hypothetical protein